MKYKKKRILTILLLITFTLLLYWVLNHSGQALALIKRIVGILSPVFVGFCIAFIINVLLINLERLWLWLWRKKRGRWIEKAKRPVCLVLSILIVLGIIFAIFFIIAPELWKSLSSFVSALPDYIRQVEGWWQNLSDFLAQYSIVLPELNLNVDEAINMAKDFIEKQGQNLVNKTVDITSSLFSVIFDAVVAFGFSIYMLAQKEKLCSQLKRVCSAVLPESRVSQLVRLASQANQTFSSFVTGQLTEAVIIGVLCFIGMMIFGMPYAPAISVLVGFTALIPVFGAFIGTAIGAILILLSSPLKALWFVVFIIVLQQLEGNLIYPKVVGKSVGLPGIWVLFAVTVGGNAFGVIGMLLSVPICSLLYSLAREAVSERLRIRNQKNAAANKNPQNNPQKPT